VRLSRGSHLALDEVVLHEALEVEVGELVLLVKLEQLGELGVGVNLATILLVLETVRANVGVNLLAHVRARHLRANRLAKELGKLVTDTRGLHKTGRLAVARRLLATRRGLLGVLELAGHNLLERLEIRLNRGEEASQLLELSAENVKLNGKGGIRVGGGGVGNYRRGGLNGRRSSRLGGSLLSDNLLGGLVNHNILDGGGSGGSGLLIRLRRSYHL